jgi:hypothetical protein
MMKGFLLVLIAAALVGAMGVAAAPPRITVVTDGVTITSEKDVTVTVGQAPSVACVPSVVAPVVKAASKFALEIPAWLGSPLARGTLYSLAAVAAVFLLQWIKRSYGWDGKKMVYATIVVVCAFGALLAYLFQDKGTSLLSNVWVLGGGAGFIGMAATVIYKLKFAK